MAGSRVNGWRVGMLLGAVLIVLALVTPVPLHQAEDRVLGLLVGAGLIIVGAYKVNKTK